MTAMAEKITGVGRVARVTGPVVDVEFPVEAMPELFNALHVDVSITEGEHRMLTLEVAQHIGDIQPRGLVVLAAACQFGGNVLRRVGHDGVMTSMPRMYGRSASGTTTLPSACR